MPTVYPNPATKHLSVRYPSISAQAVILAYDLTGRTVLNAPLSASGTTTLDISALPTGTYLWRIVDSGTEKEKVNSSKSEENTSDTDTGLVRHRRTSPVLF